ncbi:MAG: hypothetical protein JW791_05060 [Nanoarchaeota archaeon]|nr:hypothetical protein [Nanoarchaeota archaeon]
MKRVVFTLLLVLTVAGCTQQINQYSTRGVYQSVQTDYDLDVLVTDELQIRRTSLFSEEMTRLTLNLINLANVDFSNVKAVLINADDLSPQATFDYAPLIESNHSERFEWDLTAPVLGLGELLVLDNILVRVYYDAYAETSKAIILKETGDRAYRETYSESTQGPVAIYFDTSYETLTTVENRVKDFTVNLIYFNNYSGVVDYYDNTNIDDNYMKILIIGIDKTLTFYNYLDEDNPWTKVEETFSDEQLEDLGLKRDDLILTDYYYLEYQTLESRGFDLCNIETLQLSTEEYEDLQNTLTEQRRVLWMTSGYTKVNVLRLGAPTVESDTEVLLTARVEYSYSQDYGGEGFGAVVYGLG